MRNSQSHFSVAPVNLDMQRSKFERPFNHKFTMNLGDLVPFYWSEVLPGDSVSIDTSKVVRMTTLLDPVMDNIVLDTYYFFVKLTDIWDHAKEFFGENNSGPWAPSTQYTLPQLQNNTSTMQHYVGSVLDYMGIPPVLSNTLKYQAGPVRSYNKIYLDWFYDQNTQSPPNIYTGDSDVVVDFTDPVKGGTVYKACKTHDYFTSCLPQAQRGDPVSFSLADSASVSIPSKRIEITAHSSSHSLGRTLVLGHAGDTTATSYDKGVYATRAGDLASVTDNYVLGFQQSSSISPTDYPQASINRTNLVAEYPGVSSIPITGVNAITVNDLRMAFQLQRFYERAALFGGRYTEFLRANFGVTAPDTTLRRSEYLGGNRIPIQIHQVENNAAGAEGETPLGHLGAYSATSDVNSDFTHSFTQHGYLIGVCVARIPTHTYCQGVERAWSRKTMFDMYLPVFSQLGNMPVLRKEIYCTGNEEEDNNVFGYQEYAADYRYQPDRVSAFMRPNVEGSLASWHFADYYQSAPTLSADWMKEDQTNIDRALAVSSEQAPQFFCDFLVKSTWTRVMPMYSIPGLIDHH